MTSLYNERVGLSQPHARCQHPVGQASAGPDPEARALPGFATTWGGGAGKEARGSLQKM